MSGGVTLRLARPDEGPRVLRLIADLGFNPRTPETWNALSMGAVCAWEGDDLVGAVPFERRDLLAAPGRILKTAHQTCVGLREPHRGAGLGSRLQDQLALLLRDEVALLTVFREEPTSPAYRWYLKCGFTPAMRIESFFADPPARLASAPATPDPLYQHLPHDPVHPVIAAALERLADDRLKSPGHLISPSMRHWLAHHPYKGRYRFEWVIGPSGAVLLGIGRMHSSTDRVDVLAMTRTPDPLPLLTQTAHLAATHGWTPLRWAVSTNDPHLPLARSLPMQSRWTFDLLAKSLRPLPEPLPTHMWTYSTLDFA